MQTVTIDVPVPVGVVDNSRFPLLLVRVTGSPVAWFGH